MDILGPFGDSDTYAIHPKFPCMFIIFCLVYIGVVDYRGPCRRQIFPVGVPVGVPCSSERLEGSQAARLH